MRTDALHVKCVAILLGLLNTLSAGQEIASAFEL